LAQLLHVAGQSSAARLLSSALRAYGIRREGKDEESQVSTSAWQHRDAQPVGLGLSAEQLDLIYAKRDLTIDERFTEYHRQHPQVYRKLVNLARQAKGAGFSHYGMKALVERLRWHMTVERKSTEPFKINNDFASRYARYIMSMEPDLSDFLEVRRLRSKGASA
jgi:hypothetical protein